VIEIVSQVIDRLHFCRVTFYVMLEDRFPEDAPDQLVEVSGSENELEQVEAVEENLKQRLSKVNLTLEVPLVRFSDGELFAFPNLERRIHEFDPALVGGGESGGA